MLAVQRKQLLPVVPLLLAGLLLAGCAGQLHNRPPSTTRGEPLLPPPTTSLPMLGYTIQVGAFSHLDNAVRLMQSLQREGLDAYYFKHSSGLFKVRFGDFTSREEAKQRAIVLRQGGTIDSFYIVKPTEYKVSGAEETDNPVLRQHLIKTAKRFLGVPYKWGGESAREGFDCSGLAMTVYRLNGMKLPRNSRQQYRAGRSVQRGELQPGDLVFFATKGGKRINHVGIYLGNDRFIHAPRTGKTIRVASLQNRYFVKRYRGGRSYIANSRSADRS